MTVFGTNGTKAISFASIFHWASICFLRLRLKLGQCFGVGSQWSKFSDVLVSCQRYVDVYHPPHLKRSFRFTSLPVSLVELRLLLAPLQSAPLLSQPLLSLLIAPHIASENKGAQGVVILLPGTEIAIETWCLYCLTLFSTLCLSSASKRPILNA